jgi:2-oxoglutarate ferredoxin oxidoreductase subunit beta
MMGELANQTELPRPIGIFRQIEALPFDEGIAQQIATSKEVKGEGEIKDLIYQGNTWEVE